MGDFDKVYHDASMTVHMLPLAVQSSSLAACRLVPDAVVRGLQLSLGLSLAKSGVKSVWFKVAEVGAINILSAAATITILGCNGRTTRRSSLCTCWCPMLCQRPKCWAEPLGSP